MASVTVRNIDPEVKAGLRARAARNGVSMESELRTILRDAAGVPRSQPLTPEEREAKIQRILALGRPLAEPFDLKAFCDSLWEDSER